MKDQRLFRSFLASQSFLKLTFCDSPAVLPANKRNIISNSARGVQAISSLKGERAGEGEGGGGRGREWC